MYDYQIDIGEWVQWFQFNVAGTTSDPTYGTGPQRAWFPPVVVPAFIGEYSRAGKTFDDSGLYLIDSVHIIVNYQALIQALIQDPDPTGQNHQNDRVGFDGHLFTVASFTPRGRVASEFLTISVDLIELAQEELDEDADIPMFAGYIVAS